MMTEDAETRSDSRTIDKWQEAALAGWQAVPDALLKNQQKLKLSATEMVVLLNVLSYWWFVDEHPFPRSATIAKRMGVAPRTVQRAIQSLVEKNILEQRRVNPSHGISREVLDPTSLVEKLRKFAISDPAYIYKKQNAALISSKKESLDDENAARSPF